MVTPPISSSTLSRRNLSFKNHTVKQQIVDLLVNAPIKTAVVASHSRPDGDAYGTSIGMSGILKNLGVDVHAVIDDVPHGNFTYFPSVTPKKTAVEFIKRPSEVTAKLQEKNIHTPDLGIITDTAEPIRTTSQVLDLLSKTKNIIIIDHHQDSPREASNQTKWLKSLKQRGVDPAKVYFWRELRETGSEMIGELDQAVTDKLINNGQGVQTILKQKYPHRLAIAAGIASDAGAINLKKGKPYNSKFAFISREITHDILGNPESTTNNIFRWSIENSNFPHRKIDFKKYLYLPLPKKIDRLLDNVLTGKTKVEGIEVKLASPQDPLMYFYVKNMTFFNRIAEQANQKLPILKLSGENIYSEVKERLEHFMAQDKNLGILLMAQDNQNAVSRMSVRSYGLNRLSHTNPHHDGHITMDKATSVIVAELKKQNLGHGGGHPNAMGFILKQGINFKTDILPVIQNTLKSLNKIRA